MPISPGDRLGPYEIVSAIGKGGMGEVWKARDPRLGRDVAIKVSAQQFTDRFEREARAIAALNHPNVCTLFDVGPNYLVMELVTGPTLADRIRQGPIPLEEALAIAKQIADALEAAHEKSIVHRDLKPANVKIRPDGSVKVLDFGLAKAGDAQEVTPDSPTMMPGTLTGMILGTAGYMSPEQARGQEVDKRADIWAFGVVLYEMVTGKRLFDGATVSDSLAAILKEEPDLTLAPEKTRRLLSRCLEKDPRRRLRDIGDAMSMVEDTDRTNAVGAASAPETRKRKPVLLFGAVAVTCLALGAALMLALSPPRQYDISAYKFTPIAREERMETQPEWSPDGKSIAYATRIHGIDQVFTKTIGGPDAEQLTRSADNCNWPFWSPDGSTIYYTTARGLWAVGASGGNPELVLEKVGAATIHPDGKTLAFARDGKLWVGPLRGDPRQLAQTPFRADIISRLKFSPDGNRLAVLGGSVTAASALWVLSYPSGGWRNLGAWGGTGVSWLPDSSHVVVSKNTPATTFYVVDTTRGSVRALYNSPDQMREPAVSPDGKRMAYVAGDYEWNVLDISLSDRSVRPVVVGGGAAWWPDWAPSGTHFLYSTDRDGPFAIVDRFSREGLTRRLAEAPSAGVVDDPHWSPDGTRFLFYSGGTSRAKLMLSSASGGRTTTLDTGVALGFATWSPDGQWVAYGRLKEGKLQLAKVRPGSAAGSPVVLLSVGLPPGPRAGAYVRMQWSPAGDWILFPSPTAKRGLSLISPDGHSIRELTPRHFTIYGFSKDGSQVLGIYRNTNPESAEWQLYSVDVKSSEEKLLGAVDLPPATEGIAGFSLHPDGKSFLISIAKWPYDIWMLEGFDQNRSWLDRLLRR